jgi:hypothetical protein
MFNQYIRFLGLASILFQTCFIQTCEQKLDAASLNFSIVASYDKDTIESIHNFFTETRKSFAQKYPHADYGDSVEKLDTFIENRWQEIITKMNSPHARLWTITNNNQLLGSLFIEFPQKGTVHLSEVISSPLMPPVQQAIVAKIMIGELVSKYYRSTQNLICIIRNNNQDLLTLATLLGFEQSEYAKKLLESEKYPNSNWTFWEKVLKS